MPQKIYDVAIVGAGAAGMTSAIYALRAKKSVILFEEKTFGGQIINTHKIDNYPAAPGISGVEFAQKLYSQVESFGGEFEFSAVESIEKLENPLKTVKSSSKSVETALKTARTLANSLETTSETSQNSANSAERPLFSLKTSDGDTFLSRTVIVANGSSERKLGLPLEEELIGHGISYCATCDGNFFKGKTVAVYGGGNTAVYSALYLASLAKKVYVIIRRDQFRAEPHLVQKLESLGNVEVIKNSLISALNSENPSKSASKPLSLKSITLTPANTSGASPEEKILPVDGLFVLIGRVSNNAFLKNLLPLDAQGYIPSDETCKTPVEGLFCAGDTRKKSLHQLVTATSDGAIAATAAIEYLNS